jgi:hypothetical protein
MIASAGKGAFVARRGHKKFSSFALTTLHKSFPSNASHVNKNSLIAGIYPGKEAVLVN